MVVMMAWWWCGDDEGEGDDDVTMMVMTVMTDDGDVNGHGYGHAYSDGNVADFWSAGRPGHRPDQACYACVRDNMQMDIF